MSERSDKVAAGDIRAGSRLMRDIDDRMPGAIDDLKAELEKPEADAETIKAKSDTLAQASMKLGQAMYEAAQANEGEGGEEPMGSSDEPKDDVVDADYEEVDDDQQKKSA